MRIFKNANIIILLIFSLSVYCKDKEKNNYSDDSNVQITYEDVARFKSPYSNIIIRDFGALRNLYFVRDNGEEVIESTIDKGFPDNLFLTYTQVMFSTHLIKKEHKESLLVGLGGGSMVNFIIHYFPETQLDVVEIDKEIYNVSKKYFFLKESENVKIYIEDAFKFINRTDKKYDSIYMDAFLKPSSETDSTGVSIKLKTKDFYNKLKSHLKPGGVVSFNINSHEKLSSDVSAIKESFPNVYVFKKSGSGNYIIIASSEKDTVSKNTMQLNGLEIDKIKKPNFSFEKLADYKINPEEIK